MHLLYPPPAAFGEQEQPVPLFLSANFTAKDKRKIANEF
jgi:hypothetical protein